MCERCPRCKVSLEGSLIFDTFLAKYNNEERALEAAKAYGATKTEGRWSKKIGLYDQNIDRTVAWRCPNCGHEWPRDTSSRPGMFRVSS
jgi:rubrerythrin